FSSRRRHTRFSRDWSSDVCSSDLYRKDRVASITSVPEQDGILYGASSFWPFYSLEAVESSATAEEGGSNTGVIVGVVGAVLILGAGAFFLSRRRQSVAADRE